MGTPSSHCVCHEHNDDQEAENHPHNDGHDGRTPRGLTELGCSELPGFQLEGLDAFLQGLQLKVCLEGQAAVATLIRVSQVGLKLTERGIVGCKCCLCCLRELVGQVSPDTAQVESLGGFILHEGEDQVAFGEAQLQGGRLVGAVPGGFGLVGQDSKCSPPLMLVSALIAHLDLQSCLHAQTQGGRVPNFVIPNGNYG